MKLSSASVDVLNSRDTEIIPALCRWYDSADAKDRAAFRGRISDILRDRLHYGPNYSAWESHESLWLVPLLNQIAIVDRTQSYQEIYRMIIGNWSYSQQRWAASVELLEKLAENIYLNEDTRAVLKRILQSQ